MSQTKKVEAVLFASGKSMEESHIAQVTLLKPKDVKKALQELKNHYDNLDSALFIWNEGSKWKINVKEEFIPLVKSLVAETELEKAVLQTLAVVAYRSPVLQSDVVKSRGAGAYDHISELVDRGFVTKEKHGRSFKLKITDKFYNYFDVEGDADIREIFKDIKPIEPVLPKEQKRLGDLEIVAAESDEDHEKHRQEMQVKIVEIEEKREKDKDYLSEFESRLDEVKDRVDVAEKEIQDQKRTPESEEQDTASNHIQDQAPKENSESFEDKKEKDPQELVAEIEQKIEEITKKED